MTELVVAHLSDIHFGVRCDLQQLADLERFLPTLAPRAIVVSGDVAQRARHGEFQAALRFLEGLARTAPFHLVPGNHDVQWWRSVLGVLGQRVKYGKWRRYFGEDLTPVLELDDLVVAGMLSAHGFAWGSLTPNPNDTTVKGYLPAAEVARVRERFAATDPRKTRIAVLHHNVLPGVISRRWGLARPRAAQQALLTLDADLVLCGHDHTEGSGQLDGRLPFPEGPDTAQRRRDGCASGPRRATLHGRWRRELAADPVLEPAPDRYAPRASSRA